MAGSLLDTAWTVYRRRENVWTDRIAKEWSPENRGTLEARQLTDLNIWDAIIDFVGPLRIYPTDIHACAQSAMQLRQHVRDGLAWNAPDDPQDEFRAIRNLARHLQDAADLATREAARTAAYLALHPERKVA